LEAPDALDKVKLLYGVCGDKRIPTTVHDGSGGYVAFNDKDKLRSITSIEKWSSALSRFPNLKLNLAHLPLYHKRFFGRVKARHPRLSKTIQLGESYGDVYVDVSVVSSRTTTTEDWQSASQPIRCSRSGPCSTRISRCSSSA